MSSLLSSYLCRRVDSFLLTKLAILLSLKVFQSIMIALFERALYPKGNFGIKACCWIEYESRQRGIHIHHHACDHGGERMIAKLILLMVTITKQNHISAA